MGLQNEHHTQITRALYPAGSVSHAHGAQSDPQCPIRTDLGVGPCQSRIGPVLLHLDGTRPWVAKTCCKIRHPLCAVWLAGRHFFGVRCFPAPQQPPWVPLPDAGPFFTPHNRGWGARKSATYRHSHRSRGLCGLVRPPWWCTWPLLRHCGRCGPARPVSTPVLIGDLPLSRAQNPARSETAWLRAARRDESASRLSPLGVHLPKWASNCTCQKTSGLAGAVPATEGRAGVRG